MTFLLPQVGCGSPTLCWLLPMGPGAWHAAHSTAVTACGTGGGAYWDLDESCESF